ncbi:Transcription factor IIIA [Colletotrichum orbiculare MAFF 240422]|uniref:Transcription factor IIIA n=1 Tax=Colletotrichum orbiculare (strain 104-T / ATCC 96160 / CBS 514.97 / LARS 414 / MAFF 240422) TaxID=1213857 RepID=N4V3R6_COLOR|nr:Transcription factor IIIA [Colletotrichum orbiculare MAFF 240422]
MTKRKAQEAIVASEPKKSKADTPEATGTSDEDYDDTASNSASTVNADAETVLTGQTSITTRSRKFPSDLKTIPCTYPDCNKTFNRPARLAAHLRSHTDDRPFKCTYTGCDKDYREEKHLRQHIKGSHTQERAYTCTHEGCGKSFLTATRLRRHQDVHAGQERFRCRDFPPCNLSFRKHNTLQRHIRSEHLGTHAYPCTELGCNAGFDSQGALRNHTRRDHSEPRFWCEECGGEGGGPGIGFTSQALLHAHIRKEHLNCIFCDYKCTGQRDLEKHVEMYHSGIPVETRKTVACTWEGCDKKFTKKANLTVHIRTAHEGFRYVCGDVDLSGVPDLQDWSNEAGCGGGFITKANLEDHIRYVHLRVKRPQPVKPAETHTNLIDDLAGTNRTVSCTIQGCNARFIRHHDLQVHLEDHPPAAPAAPHMEDQVEAALLSLASEDPANAAPFDPSRPLPELPLYGVIPGVTDFSADDLADLGNSSDEFWVGAGADFSSPSVSWQDEEAAMRALVDGDDFSNFVDPALGNMA